MSIGNALGSTFKSSRFSKIIRSERENNKDYQEVLVLLYFLLQKKHNKAKNCILNKYQIPDSTIENSLLMKP